MIRLISYSLIFNCWGSTIAVLVSGVFPSNVLLLLFLFLTNMLFFSVLTTKQFQLYLQLQIVISEFSQRSFVENLNHAHIQTSVISSRSLLKSLLFVMNTAWKVSKYGPEIIPYLHTFHAVETVVLEWIGKKLKYISVCTFVRLYSTSSS